MVVTKDAVADVHGTEGAVEANVDWDELGWRSLLAYRTQKQIKVQVWQLGLAFKVLQLAFFGYVVYTVLGGYQWATSSGITYTNNAWVGNGASANVEFGSGDIVENPPYCNGNASYDYDYGGGWTYFNPICRRHASSAISVKGPDQVFVTTMYQETEAYGWQCDGPHHTTKVAECSADSGTLSEDGAQCDCTIQRTVFPVGVEEMTISFRHTYTAQNEIGPLGCVLKGDVLVTPEMVATNSSDCAMVLDTWFGSLKKESGVPVTFTVTEVLALVGISLDTINAAEPNDARDGIDRKPMYRTTGVGLSMSIAYSNKNPESGAPDITNTNVRAVVNTVASKGWAGLGAVPTMYMLFPDGNVYHKIDRYRQGVLISFSGHGEYWSFDFLQLVLTLAAGVVILSSAGTLTDFIAINLPVFVKERGGKYFGYKMELAATSKVLRGKRVETIDPVHVMAAQAMYAAFSAGAFRTLDEDGDGVVDAKDIVRAFAKVGGVTFMEAVELTKLIMYKGDRMGGCRDGKLSFTEFVSVTAQDLMPFGQLLKYMKRAGETGSQPWQLDLDGMDEEMFEQVHRAEGYQVRDYTSKPIDAPVPPMPEIEA